MWTTRAASGTSRKRCACCVLRRPLATRSRRPPATALWTRSRSSARRSRSTRTAPPVSPQSREQDRAVQRPACRRWGWGSGASPTRCRSRRLRSPRSSGASAPPRSTRLTTRSSRGVRRRPPTPSPPLRPNPRRGTQRRPRRRWPRGPTPTRPASARTYPACARSCFKSAATSTACWSRTCARSWRRRSTASSPSSRGSSTRASCGGAPPSSASSSRASRGL
mmetsp:Transcript_38755/g.123100  ORF Transcript_38755/g.123100 Transcript_38755/m.123100 type:complete len:222 (-) Transcript_38755:521-1186(-)